MPIHAASESPLVNPFPVRGVRRVKSRWVRVTQHDVCEAYAALIAYEGPPELAVSSVASRFGLSHVEEEDPASVHALRCEALEAIRGRVWAGLDVRLVCMCYPRRCHGEDLRAWVGVPSVPAPSARRRKRPHAGD